MLSADTYGPSIVKDGSCDTYMTSRSASHLHAKGQNAPQAMNAGPGCPRRAHPAAGPYQSCAKQR